MNHYDTFDEAARRASEGWIQGRLAAREGVCMIGAIDSLGRVERDVLLKVHARLWRHWGYRCTYWVHEGNVLAAVKRWNDLGWRRKKTVVRVLRELAEAERPAWMEDRILGLSIEVSSLREQIGELKVQIALLEAENERLWRRILGRTLLQAGLDQLEELEAELREKSLAMERLGVPS